uniref:C2H2-type domain-containing protein n=1 Tax=Graphocephala atropunctata TaxID=36148 RepID=A0A1B6MTL9_9HEMI
MSENNESSHTCVLCNTSLESKEALKEHFRKHANKEIDGKGRPVGPNGESVIDVSKFRGRGYEKGSASKFVDGVITCDVCGEKFKCNTTAIQHKFRKHPASSIKYYCPQCGMQFPLKIHRDKHLAEHSPTNSRLTVPCNDCGEKFFNRNALEYHSKSTHQRIIALYQPVLTPPPSKKIKVNNAGDPQSVYYCHLCGFEYIVKFNLQKHLEKQHTKEERDNAPMDLVKCTTCDALFYSQRAYQNHNMYHKPDDLYVTSEQQRLQTVTRVDQDFDIRRVQLGAEKYLPTYRRRKRISVPVKMVKTKPAEDSSDEMSPPSAMDTSSDSDSEKPLNKRINIRGRKKFSGKETNKVASKEEEEIQFIEEIKAKGKKVSEIKVEIKEETKDQVEEEADVKIKEEREIKNDMEIKIEANDEVLDEDAVQIVEESIVNTKAEDDFKIKKERKVKTRAKKKSKYSKR